MIAVIAFDYICSGMGTIVFLAFLMSLCDQRYTATQFALLSAVAAIGRVFVGPVAGIAVSQWGWSTFYFSTFIVALPSIAVLWALRDHTVFVD